MKRTILRSIIFFSALLSNIAKLTAQDNCIFRDPVLTIDFGSASNPSSINIFPLPNYRSVQSTCPEDGYYTFASHTSGCFRGDWLTFNQDHTGNVDGKMMLVNASPSGGVFFNAIVTDLHPNTIYEFGAWMINVCRINGGCAPLPPNILVKVLTAAGEKIAAFKTGLLSQNATPFWTRYAATFTTPVNGSTVVVTMEDLTTGGCGNDFALDDITIRECIKPVPPPPVVVQEMPQEKPVVKPTPPATKPVTQKNTAKQPPMRQDATTVKIEKRTTDSSVVKRPEFTQKPALLPAPPVLLTRENPLVKQIETTAGEIVIDLYDNGEIDGDTVSVYHNNELIVSRAGLSAQANTFRLKVDARHPHHELIMVANNLGSIPPNTSLMVITAKDKRYEVFISSSETKNAKVEIDLKE